ncbi:hypothetical protein, partial [Agrobacterium sp.]|uniref:hypothetical protein n=1 Tax=Agrobacterium sp. TaxID=361 RepID=UPI0025B95EB7
RRPAAEKLPSSAAATKTSISPARLSIAAPPVKLIQKYLSSLADYHASPLRPYCVHRFDPTRTAPLFK